METKGKYYDIERLVSNTNGNENFIHNLITIFIEKSPVDNFSQLLKEKKLTELTSHLHKIKSNLPYLANQELVEKVSEVHLLALNQKEKELNKKLPSVVNELKALISELNSAFID